MPVVIRTREASGDLDQIVDHIAIDNLPAALRWLDQVEALFLLLASRPEIGEPWNSPQFGKLRRHSQGNYLFYYRPIFRGDRSRARCARSARTEGNYLASQFLKFVEFSSKKKPGTLPFTSGFLGCPETIRSQALAAVENRQKSDFRSSYRAAEIGIIWVLISPLYRRWQFLDCRGRSRSG